MEANILEVRDRAGWLKAFPLHKGLVHIGSDPRNDIVLDPEHGEGVAPRHLQLVAVQGPQPGYRAINLSGVDIPINAPSVPKKAPEGAQEGGGEAEAMGMVLSSRQGVELADGDKLQLGEFTLVLHLRDGGAVDPPALGGRPIPADPGMAPQTSAQIGLRISLPRTSIELDSAVEGTIIVRNLGEKRGVQFALELEGLDSDCYEMGPGPILFPGAEKGVSLRFHHPRKPHPPAGDHVIRVVATSEAYPGEMASVTETIHISPFHSHKLRFVTPDVPHSGRGRRRG